MSKEVLDAIKSLEKRFDKVDKRLEGIDKRLDNIESDVKDIKKKVNKLYDFTQLDMVGHDFSKKPAKLARH